jgi:hypothetical protein
MESIGQTKQYELETCGRTKMYGVQSQTLNQMYGQRWMYGHKVHQLALQTNGLHLNTYNGVKQVRPYRLPRRIGEQSNGVRG